MRKNKIMITAAAVILIGVGSSAWAQQEHGERTAPNGPSGALHQNGGTAPNHGPAASAGGVRNGAVQQPKNPAEQSGEAARNRTGQAQQNRGRSETTGQATQNERRGNRVNEERANRGDTERKRVTTGRESERNRVTTGREIDRTA